MDEPAFLRAIAAAHDDMAPRLVYADWLDERDDPRGEFVRLQARLSELSPTDSEYEPLRAREQTLRLDLPREWLVRLDPPVWCVVGKIVNERPAKHSGIARGTRQFGPNTTIYLAGLRNVAALLDPLPNDRRYVEVVGRGRQDRHWIYRLAGVTMTRDWRVRLVADPALVLLKEAGWPGFGLPTQSFSPPEGATPVEAIRALIGAIGVIHIEPT